MPDYAPGPPTAGVPTPKPPRALCPTCGRLPEKPGIVSPFVERGVLNAFYVCERGHLWAVRWTPEEVAG